MVKLATLQSYLKGEFQVEQLDRTTTGASAVVLKGRALRETRLLSKSSARLSPILEGKVVAIKVPRSSNDSTYRRFEREADILERLAPQQSPYIIEYYGMKYVGNNQPLLFLELADDDLSAVHDEDATNRVNFDIVTIDRFVHRMVEGLRVLHSLQTDRGTGLLHRDLKPSNILLFTGGLSKIGDLGSAGFARERDDPHLGKIASGSGTYGTLEWCAPEIIDPNSRNAHYSEKSDIYSLALITLYMMAQRTPFTGYDNDFLNARRVKEDVSFFDPLLVKIAEEYGKKHGHGFPDHKLAATRRAILPDPRDRPSLDEFFSEYTTPPATTADPLEKEMKKIEGLLAKGLDKFNATAIINVDAMIAIYHAMAASKRGSAFTAKAYDLISRRSRQDKDAIHQFIEENKFHPLSGKPETDYFRWINEQGGIYFFERTRPLAALAYCWGNEFCEGYIDHDETRIPLGRIDNELSRIWTELPAEKKATVTACAAPFILFLLSRCIS